MYLRKKSGAEICEYRSLCETVRTAKGPRQRLVASLCKLDEEEVRTRGWDDIGRLLSGKPAARPGQKQLGKSLQSPPAQWEKVHLGAVSVERVREFGEVYLPLALWHRLGLGKLLEELIEPGRGNVGWETVASVLAASRFCSQRSEFGIAEGGDETTAREDLLGVDKVRINDDRLYRARDVRGRHKDKLCSHLIERYRAWLGVRMEFLLYDVTSTCFEGWRRRTRRPSGVTPATTARIASRCALGWCAHPKGRRSGAVDAVEDAGVLCPETHRVGVHHQEYGRDPAS
jgi:hypothetical protein